MKNKKKAPLLGEAKKGEYDMSFFNYFRSDYAVIT